MKILLHLHILYKVVPVTCTRFSGSLRALTTNVLIHSVHLSACASILWHERLKCWDLQELDHIHESVCNCAWFACKEAAFLHERQDKVDTKGNEADSKATLILIERSFCVNEELFPVREKRLNRVYQPRSALLPSAIQVYWPWPFLACHGARTTARNRGQAGLVRL
jgi:hypothetical protein